MFKKNWILLFLNVINTLIQNPYDNIKQLCPYYAKAFGGDIIF